VGALTAGSPGQPASPEHPGLFNQRFHRSCDTAAGSDLIARLAHAPWPTRATGGVLCIRQGRCTSSRDWRTIGCSTTLSTHVAGRVTVPAIIAMLGPGGHQRLPPDHPRSEHRMGRAPPSRRTRPLSGGPAPRNRRLDAGGPRRPQQRRPPGRLRLKSGGLPDRLRRVFRYLDALEDPRSGRHTVDKKTTGSRCAHVSASQPCTSPVLVLGHVLDGVQPIRNEL